MISTCFLLLLSAGLVRGSCLPVRIDPVGHEKTFCVRQASVRSAAALLEFANGSCRLFDACSPASPSKFRLSHVDPLRPLLLLRTRAEGRINPYTLLISGVANSTLADDAALDGLAPYKSPLVVLAAFSRVHLVLSNGTGEPDVNLTFTMTRGHTVQDQNGWFSQKNLIAAQPWDVEEIQQGKFKSFRMKGTRSDNIHFYMRLKYNATRNNDCDRRFGYLAIVKNENCDSHRSPFNTSYQWAANRTSWGFFRDRQLSLDFRLYGDLDPNFSFRMYQCM